MKKSKQKEEECKSLEEHEEKFFPNSLRRGLEESADYYTLAITLADKSIEKIRGQLVK